MYVQTKKILRIFKLSALEPLWLFTFAKRSFEKNIFKIIE